MPFNYDLPHESQRGKSAAATSDSILSALLIFDASIITWHTTTEDKLQVAQKLALSTRRYFER